MIVENQTLTAIWVPKNIPYYKAKGYVFTGLWQPFNVRIEDLSDGSNVKVKTICDYCGKGNAVKYQSISRTKRDDGKTFCRACFPKYSKGQELRLRQEKIYDEIKRICEQRGYTLLTAINEFENRLSHVRYICPAHGEQSSTVTSLKQGKGCWMCGRDMAAKKMVATTLEKRRNNLYNRLLEVAEASGYVILTEPEQIFRNTDRVQYMCNEHGIQEMRIANFLANKKCPKCLAQKNAERFRLSKDEVAKRVESVGGVLQNIDEYVNNSTRNLRFICGRCGDEFVSSLAAYTYRGGRNCPSCSHIESNGERRVRRYLELNDIDFQQWYSFKDCRDQRVLPFDFYIPSLNVCIEYDGVQHFQDVDGFGGELEYVQKHDTIKTEYCKRNKIRLIRIPYWEFKNIETILGKELLST